MPTDTADEIEELNEVGYIKPKKSGSERSKAGSMSSVAPSTKAGSMSSVAPSKAGSMSIVAPSKERSSVSVSSVTSADTKPPKKSRRSKTKTRSVMTRTQVSRTIQGAGCRGFGQHVPWDYQSKKKYTIQGCSGLGQFPHGPGGVGVWGNVPRGRRGLGADVPMGLGQYTHGTQQLNRLSN